MSNREYDTDSIRKLYEEGKAFREIARMYGISVMTTSRILRKLKVRHPPQSGWLDEWGRLKGGRPNG
jgi:DNA invertase Pin-like site-specific DNA recombinase